MSDRSLTTNPSATPDNVDWPAHYNMHPSGVECIQVNEHMSFCLGSAFKYIWRAGLKGGSVEKQIEDLRKARRYLEREINRIAGTPGWDDENG